jgi:hypothetical protein
MNALVFCSGSRAGCFVMRAGDTPASTAVEALCERRILLVPAVIDRRYNQK